MLHSKQNNNTSNQQYFPPPQSHYPPPQYPLPPSYHANENYNFVQERERYEKFDSTSRYRDLWAAILFVVHFVAFTVLSVITLYDFTIIQRRAGPMLDSASPNWSTIWLLMVCAGVGFLLSIFYMTLVNRFPRQFIKGTFIISILSYWILVVYFFVVRYYSLAIFIAILAIFYTLCWFWWKALIPFSSLILETVTTIIKKYKAMLFVAFFGLFCQMIYTIWWTFTIIAAYQVWYLEPCRNVDTKCQNNRILPIGIFLLFSYYWTSQLIASTIHVISSGVFASYYFFKGTPQGVPTSPTLKSAKRALSTSFGSVCLGSLLVAILQTIRGILRIMAQQTDNPFGQFCAVCLELIIGFFDNILQYFNFYAYVQVAVYGKSFFRAAKDTWNLILDRGVEAIINDNLINNVVLMGAFLVGLLTALFGYLYTIIFTLRFNVDESFTPLIVFIAFIVGFQMFYVMGSVLNSGTTTTFVCLAEDPEALLRTKPELYERISGTYPDLLNPLRR